MPMYTTLLCVPFTLPSCRYHLWRGYMKAVMGGSFCEMCHRLHTDTAPSYHENIGKWFQNSGNCVRVPKSMFASDAWRKYINTTTTESKGTSHQDTKSKSTRQQKTESRGNRVQDTEIKRSLEKDIKSKGIKQQDTKSKQTRRKDKLNDIPRQINR